MRCWPSIAAPAIPQTNHTHMAPMMYDFIAFSTLDLAEAEPNYRPHSCGKLIYIRYLNIARPAPKRLDPTA